MLPSLFHSLSAFSFLLQSPSFHTFTQICTTLDSFAPLTRRRRRLFWGPLTHSRARFLRWFRCTSRDLHRMVSISFLCFFHPRHLSVCLLLWPFLLLVILFSKVVAFHLLLLAVVAPPVATVYVLVQSDGIEIGSR